MVRKPPNLTNSNYVVNLIKQQSGRRSQGQAKTYYFPDLAFRQVKRWTGSSAVADRRQPPLSFIVDRLWQRPFAGGFQVLVQVRQVRRSHNGCV